MCRCGDIENYLAEDVGTGDITTNLLIEEQSAEAAVIAKERAVVAGLEEARAVFHHLGAEVELLAEDGAWVNEGSTVMKISGPAKAILIGERLALNFIARMSGIATTTAEIVRKARSINPSVRIAATRKTTPGFRYYEKKAVVLGGGEAHRYGLYDGILIKDNHLHFVSIEEAIQRAKRGCTRKRVEIEVEGYEEALRAARAGADIIMLDNFTPSEAERTYNALKSLNPHIIVEVSGGITSQNVGEYAASADVISLGSITHSVKAVNFTLEML